MENVRIRLTGDKSYEACRTGCKQETPAQVGFPAISTSTTTIAASTTGAR